MAEFLDNKTVANAIPKRPDSCHKGTFGYTALIGGSVRYSGAIRLAYLASAAMRSGVGVVKIGLPKSLIHDVIPHILESTIFPMSDEDGEFVYNESELKELTGNVKTVAFGMGIGISDETTKMLSFLLKNYSGRLIIDADGLTILASMDRSLIKDARCDIVLTPHAKEFSRLTGMSVDKILNAPTEAAIEYAAELSAGRTAKTVLLLKGSTTTITDGTRTYLSITGCPGMATAGSGDVLSGILSATCAYIDDLTMAVACGAYINGLAGEAAQKQNGAVSMIASDTVSHIAEVIKNLTD